MIYIPNYENNQCAYVRDKDTIRVYDDIPVINSTTTYTDYYVNSHYLSTTGVQTFNQYSTVPSCIDNVSTDWWYRNDISSILICILVLCIFLCIPFKVLFRLFRRFN